MFLSLALFSDSKENTVKHLCTKLCGKQLYREYFTSYYFEIIAGLMQGFWTVKTAVAHVTRGRELINATRGTWNFWNFSVSNVSKLLEKSFSIVYLTLFFQGLIDLSNKGYFLYMNLTCTVSWFQHGDLGCRRRQGALRGSVVPGVSK